MGVITLPAITIAPQPLLSPLAGIWTSPRLPGPLGGSQRVPVRFRKRSFVSDAFDR